MRRTLLSLTIVSFFLVACGDSSSTAISERDSIAVTRTTYPTETPGITQVYALTSEPTFTPTPKPTSCPTATSTPVPCHLEILVFHDQNGNEVQGTEEPTVSGAVIQVGGKYCITGDNGKCQLGPIGPGRYRLTVDTSTSNIEGLNYLFADREVFNPQKGLLIQIEGDTLVTVALGQGPFPISIAEESFGGIFLGFGELHDLYGNGNLVHHQGLDIRIRRDGPQPIYAPITGQARPGPDGTWGECNHVTIWYTQLGLNVGVGMGHLTEVVVTPNAFVRKGDLIGYIDPSLYYPAGSVACTSLPHIHMNIWGSVPGETWPPVESGLPWEVLPAGEWGWLNPEKYLPMIGNPIPMFASIDEAEAYARR